MINNFRTCIVTRSKNRKENMFRIVKTKDKEILIDLEYRCEGRGAYILKDLETLKKGEKINSLEKTFKTKIDKKIYGELINILNGKGT